MEQKNCGKIGVFAAENADASRTSQLQNLGLDRHRKEQSASGQRSCMCRSERRARSSPAAAIISKPTTGVSMSELTRYHQNPRGLCLPSRAIKKQKSRYTIGIAIRPAAAEQLNPEAVTRSPHFHCSIGFQPVFRCILLVASTRSGFCFLLDLTCFLRRRFGLHLRYRQFALFELARKIFPYRLGIEIQECTT
jgi:hypothetical protein